MKIIIIITAFAFFYSTCFGQFSPLNFYKITNEQGLSQASVNVMYKDRDGFLWVGTDDGLNRFDGKSLKTFYHQFNDTFTMAANEVYGICEDRYNRLWVCHYNAGISIYNRQNNKFIRLDNSGDARTRLSTNKVYGLFTDTKGFIWARTVTGISQVDPRNLTIKNFDDSSTADLNTVNIDITEFEHCIWFGSKEKGLLTVSRHGKNFNPANWNIFRHGASVTGIFHDGQQLLVASEIGLFTITKRNGCLTITSILEDPVLFQSATKLCRLKKTDHVLVATARGLLIIDINQKKLVRHIKSGAVTDNLLSNVIYCLLQDEEENIIVGTNRGINISSPYTSLFNNYENIFRKIPGFGHPVYAIHELKNRDLLIGTRNGGAWYFDIEKNEATSILIPPRPANDIHIYHFTRLDENHFLMCTSKGIWELYIGKQERIVRRPINYPELKPLSSTAVTDLVFANDSIAYISAFTDGFYKWNFKRRSIRQYKTNIDNPYKGPVNNELLNIVPLEDRLILCTKFGFSIYYPAVDSFFNVLPGKNYPYDLPARNIKDAYDDGTHIWLATFGAGVQKFNKRTRLFSGYTVKEGLPNNSVYAVVPDGNGSIWIPTNSGLAVLDTRSGKISVFTTSDGLPDNEFNAYASYKSESGSLHFSTLNGIVSIKPERVINNPHRPKIALVEFRCSSKQQDSGFNVHGVSRITVPAGFNSFYFQFASLSLAAPDKNEYRIKLDHFDPHWVHLTNQHFTRYSNLSPGNYTFRVVGSNNSGIWSEPVSLNIFVTPFWYETWWFKLFIVLLVPAILYGVYRYRVMEILRVERLRRKISNDLHDDIGSTLSSINIYSELAKAETDNKSYLDTIQQYTQATIANLDDIVWSINPKNDTLSILADRMRSFALPFLSAKNIACNFVTDIEQENFTISLEQRTNIYLAMKEITNNVVRHSCSTHCDIHLFQKGRVIALTVKDNGKGFDLCDVNTQRSGLQSVDERAKKLKGSFKIDSKPGAGSTVTFSVML